MNLSARAKCSKVIFVDHVRREPMIKKIIVAIVVIFAIFVAGLYIAASMQATDFKITRSAVFSAPPEKVFDQINDFHKWDAWSPWAKLDPNMKVTHSGAASGVGASYAWAGNGDVGEGKMTITQSHPSEHIAIDLDFIAPFAAKNVTEFTFKPEGDKTSVTWSMAGKKNFVMKLFCLFFDMDKAVGADFEKGLAQLKPVVEAGPKQ